LEDAVAYDVIEDPREEIAGGDEGRGVGLSCPFIALASEIVANADGLIQDGDDGAGLGEEAKDANGVLQAAQQTAGEGRALCILEDTREASVITTKRSSNSTRGGDESEKSVEASHLVETGGIRERRDEK
jgi:hypothetical protein